METLSDAECRERFEAWFPRSGWRNDGDLTRTADGTEYVYPAPELAWRAFRAGHSAADAKDAARLLELLIQARKWMNEAVGASWVVHDSVNPDLFSAIDAAIKESGR